MKPQSAKTKISIAHAVKKQQHHHPTPLEEQQNKENENPLKDPEDHRSPLNGKIIEPPEEITSSLYAQVSARLEPEGESRDTEEDEADRAFIINAKILTSSSSNNLQVLDPAETDRDRLYNYANIGIPYKDDLEEYVYTIPKPFSTNDIDRLNEKIENPEDLYAAINKTGLPKKAEFTVPDNEEWKVDDVQKTLQIVCEVCRLD